MTKVNIPTTVPITGYEPSPLPGSQPRPVYDLESGIEEARQRAVKELNHPNPERGPYSVIVDQDHSTVWLNSIWSA